MDLDVEHQNKIFKADIGTSGGEITENILNISSRSGRTTEVIVTNFDSKFAVHGTHGKHVEKDHAEDVMLLVDKFPHLERSSVKFLDESIKCFLGCLPMF